MIDNESPAIAAYIDSHHHLWKHGRYDYGWIEEGVGPLGEDYLLEDLDQTISPCGVIGTVVVQTIPSVEETRWFCELADASDTIFGVVGWVDLRHPQVGEVLDQLSAASRKFVGVRVMAQGHPDDNLLISDALTAGFDALRDRQLTCDLLLLPAHLPHVPTLAERHPDLRFIIDHLAKPPIKSGAFGNWKADLGRAAEYGNVYCKLSGMITEADHEHWTADDLRPFIRHAVECFGPRRSMFGSDWPVCLLAGSYREMLDALLYVIDSMQPSDQASVMRQTAIDFYRLDGS